MASKAINKYNTAVSLQSGKVGTVRYFQRGGETYVRSASNSIVNNPRTNPQMAQRMRFASLNHLWSCFDGMLKGSFANKQKNQTDCNAFMKANQGVGVYFTKEQIAANASLPMPAKISDGSLGTITITSLTEGDKAVSNINIGGASIATVKDFSAAIVGAMKAVSYGDVLSVFYLSVVEYEDVPQVWVTSKQVTLSKTDSTALTGFSVEGNYLAATLSAGIVACGIVIASSKNMSASYIGLSEAQKAVYESYLTDEVFAEAAATYGTAEKKYLNGGDTVSSSKASDATVTKYTLSLSASPTNGGTVTGAGSYEAGTSVTVKATANSGHTFQMWQEDGNTNAERTVTVNADLNLTAVFTANSTPSGGDEGGDDEGLGS